MGALRSICYAVSDRVQRARFAGKQFAIAACEGGVSYDVDDPRPYAWYARTLDVNGDGRADQGRVPTGYHEYAQSSWKNGYCLRPTSDFSVQRV